MIILIILPDLCNLRISGLGLLTRGLGLGKLSLSPPLFFGHGYGMGLKRAYEWGTPNFHL